MSAYELNVKELLAHDGVQQALNYAVRKGVVTQRELNQAHKYLKQQPRVSYNHKSGDIELSLDNSYAANMSMMVFGGILVVLGIIAMVLALTLFAAATFGAGLVIGGGIAALGGIGLFSAGVYRNSVDSDAKVSFDIK